MHTRVHRIFFIILILLMTGCASLISVVPVQAHIHEADGDIQAVLHIEPGHDPAAGEPAHLYFTFTDADHELNLESCDCTVSILAASTTIFSQSFASTTDAHLQELTFDFPYTFPEKRTYTVIVTGEPVGAALFGPFSLTYPVVVARDASQPLSLFQKIIHSHLFLHHGLHILVFGIGILIGAFIIIRSPGDPNFEEKGKKE